MNQDNLSITCVLWLLTMAMMLSGCKGETADTESARTATHTGSVEVAQDTQRAPSSLPDHDVTNVPDPTPDDTVGKPDDTPVATRWEPAAELRWQLPDRAITLACQRDASWVVECETSPPPDKPNLCPNKLEGTVVVSPETADVFLPVEGAVDLSTVHIDDALLAAHPPSARPMTIRAAIDTGARHPTVISIEAERTDNGGRAHHLILVRGTRATPLYSASEAIRLIAVVPLAHASDYAVLSQVDTEVRVDRILRGSIQRLGTWPCSEPSDQ